MLSKNAIKRISSLRIRKYREESGVFVAEGCRLVDEILTSELEVKELYHTSEWKNSGLTRNTYIEMVSVDEMKKISGQSSPTPVLSIVSTPKYSILNINFATELVLALDTVQDPGNLGTIIRLADWFGINSVICSNGTADAFSPKVVQSSMGAITRVKVIYCDLPSELAKHTGTVPVYGAFMEGNNIYTANLSQTGIVVMGNEGNGISPAVAQLVTQKIHIPTYANDRTSVESLNVAMATAIICSEFRRR